MKRGQFSYQNGRSQSHASLNRFRKNGEDDSHETISTRPNVKMFAINHDQKNNQKNIKKIAAHKTSQQLTKQNKVLEYELKKKLNENSVLSKFLKTKNSSQLSHIDIYLMVSKMQEQLQQSQQKRKDCQQKIQELSLQYQNLQQEKQCDELEHINQIKEASNSISRIEAKNSQKMQQLAQKVADKQKQIQNQKQRKQEIRILLDQIRKKYEQLKSNYDSDTQQYHKSNAQLQKLKAQTIEKQIMIQGLKKQLETETDCLKRETKIHEHTFEQKILKYNHQIENYRDQIEKSKVREKQQQLVIQQMKNYYEEMRVNLQQSLKTEKNRSRQFQNNLEKFQLSLKEISASLQKYKQKVNKLQHEKKQLQNKLKQEIDETKDKYMKENSKLHEKCNEQEGRINILIYQKTEKQSLLSKYSEKQSFNQKKQDQLQQQLYLSKKKYDSVLHRVKQLQKLELDHQQRNKIEYRNNKNQIQNYKAIGRIIQLIHHMKSLLSINTQKNSVSTVDDENICSYVSVLADLQQLFIKVQYNPLLDESKCQKQEIQELNNSLKLLINAYNNYVQDQELNGYACELFSESVFTVKNKQTAKYIQLIIEKLIAMNAIKSYASDQGANTLNGNNNHFSSYRSRSKDRQRSTDRYRDSLNSTLQSRRGQNQSKKSIYLRANNSIDFRNRNRNNQRDNISNILKAKLQTEPSEICSYADDRPRRQEHIRKLYKEEHQKHEKQNNKNNLNRIADTDKINMKYFSHNDRFTGQLIKKQNKQQKNNKQEIYEDYWKNQNIQSRKVSQPFEKRQRKRNQNLEAQAIQKKYFR